MRPDPTSVTVPDGTCLRILRTAASGSAVSRGGEGNANSSSAGAKGAVVLIHGLGEHSGRYDHVAGRLAFDGWDVIRYDQRGHGRSAGRKGDVPAFNSLLNDLDTIVTACVAEDSETEGAARPLFLYGHSLGGLVAIRYLQEQLSGARWVRGAVIASPWLALAFEPPRWKLLLAACARRVWPAFTQSTGLEPGQLSRNPDFIRSIPGADLNHTRLSARFFDEIRTAAQVAREHPGTLPCPLLLLHGQADPITSWVATQAFFEKAATPEQELRVYPDAFHELHNDPVREEAGADILRWLNERIARIPR